jgi:hypothetical protein
MICSLRSDGDEKSKSERGNEGGDGGLHIHKDGYTHTVLHTQTGVNRDKQTGPIADGCSGGATCVTKTSTVVYPIERFNVCLRPAQLNGTSLTN